MKSNELKKIEDRLIPPPAPEPPEELFELIRAEIPEHLGRREGTEPAHPRPGWRGLLAASVVLALVGGVFAYRVIRESPAVEDWSVGLIVEEVGPEVDVPPSGETPEAGSTGKAAPRAPEAERFDLDRTKAGVDALRRAGDLQGQDPAREWAVPEPDSPELGVARTWATTEVGAPQDQAAPPRPGNEGVEARRRSMAVTKAPPEEELERQREDIAVPEARVAGPAKEAAPRSTISPPTGDSVAQRMVESAPGALMVETEAGRFESLRPAAPGQEIRETPPVPGAPETWASAPPSTGGTAEPNDQPYGDMFFRHYGVNPFVDTEDDRLSTFGLDVDTGSYTLTRSYLERGHLPPPEAVRVEEFVNAFDPGDPAPRRGEFTLTAEGAPSPFAEGPRYYLVRFGIRGRDGDARRRPPTVLTFVIDTSGSMARENRLGLVKRSLEMLLDQLRPGDRVGLVVYGSRGRVLLEPTADLEAVRQALWRLGTGGSTNAEEGLRLGYEVARRWQRGASINRIILCSDGVANVGRTGPESILATVRGATDDGIRLSTFGFGMGNYNDVLMEQLADQGDGAYAYVDTLEEARRLFVDELAGTLETIASDAKVQVEFAPEAVSRYRLLGYENRDVADHRFRDDTVDAGEVGAGHSVTALYEIKLREGVGRRARLATLRLRYRSEETGRVSESAVDLDAGNLASRWERSSLALRLSSLAAEIAEVLRGSYWAKNADLADLERRARRLADDLRGSGDARELLELVGRVRRLSPPAWQGDEPGGFDDYER